MKRYALSKWKRALTVILVAGMAVNVFLGALWARMDIELGVYLATGCGLLLWWGIPVSWEVRR